MLYFNPIKTTASSSCQIKRNSLEPTLEDMTAEFETTNRTSLTPLKIICISMTQNKEINLEF